MTQFDRKQANREKLIDQCTTVTALKETWLVFAQRDEYNPETQAYLRELKRKERILKQRIRNLSL